MAAVGRRHGGGGGWLGSGVGEVRQAGFGDEAKRASAEASGSGAGHAGARRRHTLWPTQASMGFGGTLAGSGGLAAVEMRGRGVWQHASGQRRRLGSGSPTGTRQVAAEERVSTENDEEAVAEG